MVPVYNNHKKETDVRLTQETKKRHMFGKSVRKVDISPVCNRIKMGRRLGLHWRKKMKLMFYL